MQSKKPRDFIRRAGFGLVEIMVGLAIGMIATLVIVQVVSTFEGQKRSSSGSNEAQTNGSVALYTIQRQAEMAGFGLPIYSDGGTTPLNCDGPVVGGPLPTLVDALSPAPGLGISPVTIVDGGAGQGASDTITLRGGTSTMAAVPMTVSGIVGPTVSVNYNLGCSDGDAVIVSRGSNCVMSHVAVGGVAGPTTITLLNAAGVTNTAALACLGGWTETTFRVVNSNLQVQTATSGAAVPAGIAVAGIVNIQVQYGYSNAANTNPVVGWVDASDIVTFGDPATSHTARNRIKAIRIAIVARNGLLEKTAVTNALVADHTCTTAKGVVNYGPCAWDDALVSPAPRIDLRSNADGTANPDWARYRYRVFETIIPLRNVISNSALLT